LAYYADTSFILAARAEDISQDFDSEFQKHFSAVELVPARQ